MHLQKCLFCVLLSESSRRATKRFLLSLLLCVACVVRRIVWLVYVQYIRLAVLVV